jgi:hypothetical protein
MSARTAGCSFFLSAPKPVDRAYHHQVGGYKKHGNEDEQDHGGGRRLRPQPKRQKHRQRKQRKNLIEWM